MRTPALPFMRRLAADERGTSLLEFGFLAPILAVLVVGIGDLARGYSEVYALQQAASRTLELAHLGSTQDNYDFLKTEAAAAATAVGVTGATVSLESWLECDGTTTKKPFDDTCGDGEELARYVTLRINSNFQPSFGTFGYPGANANGTIPIGATASVRVQ